MHIARDSTWALCVLQLTQDLSQKKKKISLFDASPDLHGENWQPPWQGSEGIFP